MVLGINKNRWCQTCKEPRGGTACPDCYSHTINLDELGLQPKVGNDPRWEEYCREFLKGCGNTVGGKPQDCPVCLPAFIRVLQRLMREVDAG